MSIGAFNGWVELGTVSILNDPMRVTFITKYYHVMEEDEQVVIRSWFVQQDGPALGEVQTWRLYKVDSWGKTTLVNGPVYDTLAAMTCIRDKWERGKW